MEVVGYRYHDELDDALTVILASISCIAELNHQHSVPSSAYSQNRLSISSQARKSHIRQRQGLECAFYK